MAATADKRNPLPKLVDDQPPADEPLKMKPLDESHLFDKKDKNIEIKVEEKTEPSHEEAPLVVQKPPKKPRKKRVLSEAHRKALAAGRAKGLATRRAKAAARKAKAAELAGLKEKAMLEKHEKKAATEHKRTLALAKKLKNTEIRKEYEAKSIKKVADPDSEFKKFYSMMSRYEKMRAKEYLAARKKRAPQAQPPPIQRQNAYRKPSQKRVTWQDHSNRKPRGPMAKPPQNNYMHFFT